MIFYLGRLELQVHYVNNKLDDKEVTNVILPGW